MQRTFEKSHAIAEGQVRASIRDTAHRQAIELCQKGLAWRIRIVVMVMITFFLFRNYINLVWNTSQPRRAGLFPLQAADAGTCLVFNTIHATTRTTINIATHTQRATEDLEMDSSTSKMAPQTSLFQVYLRLRPTMHQTAGKQAVEPWLITEDALPKVQEGQDDTQRTYATHVTLQPPHESRKRAIERFGFTKVFPEQSSQLDLFEEIGAVENIQNVLKNGRDGLIATLGVTGSGKVRKNSSSFAEHQADSELRAIQYWAPNHSVA